MNCPYACLLHTNKLLNLSSHVLPTVNVKKSSIYEFQNSAYEQNFVPKRGYSDVNMHKGHSTVYFINIQLISFISSCFELKDKLGSEITTLKNG